MIRINRANVPEPAILQSERVKLARSRARNHFQRPFAQRSQIRFTFDTGIFQTEDLRRALTDLCEGKCAYCESAIGAVAPAQIDRYRPRSFAGTDRTIKRDHYWWLAYEWSNLYLCCPVCSRNKGRRFPVEGERAEQLTFGEDLLNAEKPLLLDPGADHPDDHLAFDDNGLVLAKTLRGQTTIDALGLNRSDLVNARRHELDFIRNFSRRDPNKTDAAWMQIVQQTLSNPRQAYLGAIRQFVARELKRWTGLKSEAPPIERFVDKVLGLLGAGISTASVYALVGSLPTNVPLDSQIKRLLTESFTQEESSSAFTISEERVDNAYYGKTRLVEYVEITDFRKIHSLKLRFDTSQSHLAPWTMLLGENGVGKSSVLQAIALTLIDQDYRKRLKLNPKTFIRKGARSAKVRVWALQHDGPGYAPHRSRERLLRRRQRLQAAGARIRGDPAHAAQGDERRDRSRLRKGRQPLQSLRSGRRRRDLAAGDFKEALRRLREGVEGAVPGARRTRAPGKARRHDHGRDAGWRDTAVPTQRRLPVGRRGHRRHHAHHVPLLAGDGDRGGHRPHRRTRVASPSPMEDAGRRGPAPRVSARAVHRVHPRSPLSEGVSNPAR